MFTWMTFRRYAIHPLRTITSKKTPDILTFGIERVENSGRGNAVFISKPEVSSPKNLRRDGLNVQNGESWLGGFNGMIHWSRKFEEHVGRIVDHV
jgi:hypothetical protein